MEGWKFCIAETAAWNAQQIMPVDNFVCINCREPWNKRMQNISHPLETQCRFARYCFECFNVFFEYQDVRNYGMAYSVCTVVPGQEEAVSRHFARKNRQLVKSAQK